MTTESKKTVDKEEKKSEAQLMIERAKAREEQILRVRKESPADVTAGAPTFVDPRWELVRMYAPECIPELEPGNPRKIIKPATRAEFFAPRKDMLKYVNKGYVPVLNESGEYVQDEGDVLFTRDASVARAELQEAQSISRRRVGGKSEKSNELGVKEEIDVTVEGGTS